MSDMSNVHQLNIVHEDELFNRAVDLAVDLSAEVEPNSPAFNDLILKATEGLNAHDTERVVAFAQEVLRIQSKVAIAHAYKLKKYFTMKEEGE